MKQLKAKNADWGIAWDGDQSCVEYCNPDTADGCCGHDLHVMTFAEGKREVIKFFRERIEGDRQAIKSWRKAKAKDYR